MRRFARTRPARLLGLVTAVTLVAVGAIAAAALPASAATTASVSINAGQSLATFPTTGIGMNVAVYDGNMNAADIPPRTSADRKKASTFA